MKSALFFGLTMLLVLTGPVAAQRKIKIVAQRISGDQVQITFEGIKLQYLFDQPGRLAVLKERFNGCEIGCSKVPGVTAASIESFPNNPKRWRIVLSIDLAVIENKSDLGTFMNAVWIPVFKEFLPPDTSLTVKDRAWHMKDCVVAKS